MAIKNTLESRISYRIKRSKANVFTRQDFADIGGYDQVGRILRQLIRNKQLISLGYGLYALAKVSSISGKIVPVKSIQDLACEALNKLGVKTTPTSAELAYNEGKSTQVPTGRVIGVKSRISRKISYDGTSIAFEKTLSRAYSGCRP
jgi:hypothetical protein